jgi:hypothetical protein
VARADGSANVTVERGEAQRVASLVAEHEVHACGAQTAGAVVEQQRTSGIGRGPTA